jgi:hypothetical protein
MRGISHHAGPHGVRDAWVNKSLYVGELYTTYNLTVSENATVKKILTVNGSATVARDLTANGNTTLSSLQVKKAGETITNPLRSPSRRSAPTTGSC